MVKDLANGQLRYYGRVPCLVIDNVDPGAKGRIRIKHPVFGPSGWIYYLRTPGAYDVPSKNDVVYVEAEWGNPQYLVAWGNLTKGQNGPVINSAFKRKAPTNKGLFTPAGHLIELDDGLNTNVDIGIADVGIRITTATGKKIHISDTNNRITIEGTSGSYIIIDDNTNTTTIENTHIKLGAAATESVIKGDVFKTYFDGHMHTGNLGAPTSPPIVPIPPTNLSTKVKTE